MSVKILLVEDDPLVARGLLRLLPSLGHIVLPPSIADSKTAVERMSVGQDIDPIITDLGLADSPLGGVSVLAAAQKQKIAAILFTGSETAADVALRFGATFLKKPVRKDDLQAAIKAALAPSGPTNPPIDK